MSKFGLMDPDDAEEQTANASFADKLAAFPPAAPRLPIDIAAMDAAAATHGFISREPTPQAVLDVHFSVAGRRRRVAVTEPTRHLAIRLTLSQYQRFVAYADRHELTYHDALGRLLDESSGVRPVT